MGNEGKGVKKELPKGTETFCSEGLFLTLRVDKT